MHTSLCWAPLDAAEGLMWPVEIKESNAEMALVHFIGIDQQGSVAIDACLPFAEHLDSLRHASSEQSFQFAVNEALDLLDFYQHQDKAEVEETDFSADLFSPSFRNGAATAQFTSSAVAPSNPVLLGTRILIRRVDLLHAKLRPYANCTGEITQVPKHPVTWYVCRLDNGSTIKLRRSAFDPIVASPKKTVHQTSLHQAAREILDAENNSALANQPVFATPVHVLRKRTATPSSSQQNSPAISGMGLIGRMVTIEAGRHTGRTGLVLRGANGYYHVHLTMPEEDQHVEDSDEEDDAVVLKRSADLRSLSSGIVDASTLSLVPIRSDVPASGARKRRPGSATGSRCSSQTPSRAPSVSPSLVSSPMLRAQHAQHMPALSLSEPTSRSVSPTTRHSLRARVHSERDSSRAGLRERDAPAVGAIGIDSLVIVRSGKHAGCVGQVRRSGHGFYALTLRNAPPADGNDDAAVQEGEEIMKRASELELYNPARYERVQAELQSNQSSRKAPRTAHHASPALRGRELEDMDDDDLANDESQFEEAASVLLDIMHTAMRQQQRQQDMQRQLQLEHEQQLQQFHMQQQQNLWRQQQQQLAQQQQQLVQQQYNAQQQYVQQQYAQQAALQQARAQQPLSMGQMYSQRYQQPVTYQPVLVPRGLIPTHSAPASEPLVEHLPTKAQSTTAKAFVAVEKSPNICGVENALSHDSNSTAHALV